jgi:hypothetical protein
VLKTPTATLLLLILALCVGAQRWWTNRLATNSYMTVFALALAVLVVMAIVSGRGRGVRYLLPAIPLAYLLAVSVLARVRGAAIILTAAVVLSAADLAIPSDVRKFRPSVPRTPHLDLYQLLFLFVRSSRH